MVQTRSDLEDADTTIRARPVQYEPIERPKPGRPRDARVHQAILDTTLQMLSEVGYGRLTIEGVAARAGVGKGTIYRHWPSKGALVVEVISGPICPIATGKWTVRLGSLPDSGTLRGDLLTFVQRVHFAFTAPLASETLPGLAMDLAQDPDLADRFRECVVEPKRACLAEALERARQRGEVGGEVDVHLLCDMLVGPVLYRSFLTRQAVDDEVAGELVDRVLRTLPLTV
ncbi:MAG TPA: TetR/AcrR family transcriptional regulator [Actinomycetes bacterium]|nr:TetR/AcrR family transcriptional regulator [Actinomycetes bacterium]